MTPRQLISDWLARRLADDVFAWLEASTMRIQEPGDDADLYLSISLVTRKVGKADLALSAEDLRRAEAVRAHWNPRDWSLDQTARIALLLALESDPQRLARCLEQLCITGDLNELVAFYSALPLYPDPPRYVARAAEGLRSNIKTLFAAVAHHNPYPGEQLSEAAWNQMVLKALFIDLPLWPIVGLDQRGNARLAAMLCDYAHERWSAGRPVNPELWRCVGPFASGPLLQDLERAFRTGAPAERRAAALALHSAPDPAARELLQDDPALRRMLAAGELTWERLRAAG